MKKIKIILLSLLMVLSMTTAVVATGEVIGSENFEVSFDKDEGLVIRKSSTNTNYQILTVGKVTILNTSNGTNVVFSSNKNEIYYSDDGTAAYINKYLIKDTIKTDGTYSVTLTTINPNLVPTIGSYQVEINPSTIEYDSYPEGTNVTFGLKGEGIFAYYYVRGLSGIVNESSLKVEINGNERYFDKDDSGDFTCPKNYLDMYVPKGVYQPTINYGSYKTLVLNQFEIGEYKENRIIPNFNASTKEIELDFSGFEESEREELIKLFLDPSYKEEEISRSITINAFDIDNNLIKDDDVPIYRDENTLKVKSWAIDMVKQSESLKNNNGGFVSIEGYTNVQLGNFTFESTVSGANLSANIFQEKDYVFLDIDCGSPENLNKILLLRNIGVAFTKQMGVGSFDGTQ